MTLLKTKESPDKEEALKIKVRGYYEDDYYGKPIVKWASACLGARYEWGGYSSDKRYAGGKESSNLGVSGGDYSGTGYVNINGTWTYVTATPEHQGYGFDCSGLVSHVANICGYFSGYKTTLQLDDPTVTDTVASRSDLHAGDLLLRPGHHVRIVIETPTKYGDGDYVKFIEAAGEPYNKVRIGEVTFGELENPSHPYKYKRLK